MPVFPTYHGELPQSLSLRRLRHYFLLAYWIYFRPTALKAYLYQLDPDLYRSGPEVGSFQRTWRSPAYRHLYLMIIFLALLAPGLMTLLVVVAASWLGGIPIDWVGWVAVVAGMVLSAAAGILLAVVTTVTTGNVEFGVVIGVVVAVAVGAALGVARVAVIGLAGVAVLGLVFGVTVGVAFSLAVGVAGGVVFGLVFGLAGMVAGDVVFGLAFGSGALRILFYPWQLGLAVYTAVRHRLSRHPLEWDELVVFPLLGTARAASRRLRQDQRDGLRFIADVARNPFQRWVAQRILQAHLHEQHKPLHFLYTLLSSPELDTYVFAPVGKSDWELLPTTRQLLLGELAGQLVNCSNDPINRIAERLVWSLTRLLRDRRQTPLTRFGAMLYHLLDGRVALREAEKLDLSRLRETYSQLRRYPGGPEIAQSFETMAAFLSYRTLADLPAASEAVSELILDNALIRPTVLTALIRLGDVGAEMAAYRDATSRVNQLAALARAIDALDDLDEYVQSAVMAPERLIVRRIIRQWRRIVSEVSREVGRAEEVGPVANPYVVGNPVSGHLFVGREDVMRRLEELWGRPGQSSPSVVLFGHRRMGKSSVLQNLGARFGARTVVVDFNMQRVGLIDSTGELLLNLALALYDSLPLAQRRELAEPDEERFLTRNPFFAFDRFLKQIDRVRAERRFIVTVDEFELIEQMITAGRLEAVLLHFWRGLIQTYPWFLMAFAGLHTLQEMTRDYWHPLFGSVTSISVSFLGHEAARRLIVNPAPEFALDYDPEAVERVITLTHGQPYLIQLIGHALVTRFNRQTFEEGLHRERRLTLADVNAVINAPEFYRDGDAYFSGVWAQAEGVEPAGQTALLHVLAQSNDGLSLAQVEELVDLPAEQVQQALSALARHDIVQQGDGRWHFTVELMCRWVRHKIAQGREMPG